MRICLLFILSLVLLTRGLPAQELQIDSFLKEILLRTSPVHFEEQGKFKPDFLEHYLRDKKIVMLGEQTHFDGTTKQIQLNVIKFLHEQMGFNVLMDEIPMTGAHWIRTASRTKSDFVLGNIYELPFSQTSYELYSYIYDSYSTENPLLYFGIDVGSLNAPRYYRDSFRAIDSTIMHTTAWSYYDSALQMLYNGNLDLIDLKSLKSAVDNMIMYVKHARPDLSDNQRFLLQVLMQTYTTANYLQAVPADFFVKHLMGRNRNNENGAIEVVEQLRVRDSLMFENFDWLYNHVVKGSKVIITASSYHISKNLTQLRERGYLHKAKGFGEYLCDQYPKDSYSIAFMRYEGHNGLLIETSIPPEVRAPDSTIAAAPVAIDTVYLSAIKQSSEQSLESLLNKLDYPFAFINIAGNNTSQPLRHTVGSSALLGNWYTLDWSQLYDGIFFIKTMEPIIAIPTDRLISDRTYTEIVDYFDFENVPVNDTHPHERSRKDNRRIRRQTKKEIRRWKN